MIDLHSHTTASDGEHGPAELVELAYRAGVRHLAVTDHDTVAALAEAKAACRAKGMELVPGIEISAFLDGKEVHLLGHFVDPTTPRLLGLSAHLRKERYERMQRMVEKVRSLGFPVSFKQVLEIAGDANLARPHLARLLMALGYCASTQDAFDRYLGDGRPGWVDRYRVTAKEAISLIREAHGCATLAHPGVSKVERFQIEALAAAGLGGLEVYHSDHNPSVRQKYQAIADSLGLVATCGSDYHGPRVSPDRKLGGVQMPEANLEALRRKAASDVL